MRSVPTAPYRAEAATGPLPLKPGWFRYLSVRRENQRERQSKTGGMVGTLNGKNKVSASKCPTGRGTALIFVGEVCGGDTVRGLMPPGLFFPPTTFFHTPTQAPRRARKPKMIVFTRSAKPVAAQTARSPRSIRTRLSLSLVAPSLSPCRLETWPAVKRSFWVGGAAGEGLRFRTALLVGCGIVC